MWISTHEAPAVACVFLKSQVEKGLIKIVKVPTSTNPVDFLTKVVPEQQLNHCLSLLPMLRRISVMPLE